MKKINLMIAGVLAFYMVLFIAALLLWQKQGTEYGREYLVEVNRLMRGMEEKKQFSMPDLHELEYIESVSYLSTADAGDTQKAEEFFYHKNGYETQIEPLMADGKVLGFVRFDYRNTQNAPEWILFMCGLLIVSAGFTLTVLVYIKNKVLKPFSTLSNVPYELSKGHLQPEIEENKNRFFGKFIWGVAMLSDNLKSAQMKTLKLEKEKKMLLLSISHDIKTPLNSIKLYAKALEEDLYDTQEKKRDALRKIESLSVEIENFVGEIIRTSSEEILAIEVEDSEFYLKDLVEMIKEYYEPKCRLVMTEFHIGGYENRLMKGDKDRVFEVVENIMENAFKYGDGKSIEISFYEEDYCQLIRIENTGEPAKPEEMPHLFDSFYRGSNVNAQEGNGLGLYICREIMQKMGGEIFAERREDGMSFQLVFPM
ncbi:MAG: HAMP domain-containing histidine kinase [Lachnospiraceae bacterium]|nr:HAMP domain-containing histidine kinase [Lachnospiraceae bacterium]